MQAEENRLQSLQSVNSAVTPIVFHWFCTNSAIVLRDKCMGHLNPQTHPKFPLASSLQTACSVPCTTSAHLRSCNCNLNRNESWQLYMN